MRLKPTAKKIVGGTTSRSSLIRNAERPDLDINRFVRAFTADTRGVTQLTIAHPKSQEEFHRDDFTRSLQTDLGRWSNDDISNGYRLAARQWQEAEILLTLRVTIRVIFAPFRPALINLRSYIHWPDGRALGKLVQPMMSRTVHPDFTPVSGAYAVRRIVPTFRSPHGRDI